jgi:hypothetical protein
MAVDGAKPSVGYFALDDQPVAKSSKSLPGLLLVAPNDKSARHDRLFYRPVQLCIWVLVTGFCAEDSQPSPARACSFRTTAWFKIS